MGSFVTGSFFYLNFLFLPLHYKISMEFNEDGLRNFKDFLSTYNKLSEACFNSCIINLNHRKLTAEEVTCADLCVQKQMNFNNRAVGTFMVEQPKITEKRMADAEAEANKTLEKLKE